MSDNIYDAARAVLKERGWGQGAYGVAPGPVCLVGALGVATDGNVLAVEDSVITSLQQVIAEQFPERSSTPELFNDELATTFEDVDLVLDKAGRIHDERAS